MLVGSGPRVGSWWATRVWPIFSNAPLIACTSKCTAAGWRGPGQHQRLTLAGDEVGGALGQPFVLTLKTRRGVRREGGDEVSQRAGSADLLSDGDGERADLARRAAQTVVGFPPVIV